MKTFKELEQEISKLYTDYYKKKSKLEAPFKAKLKALQGEIRSLAGYRYSYEVIALTSPKGERTLYSGDEITEALGAAAKYMNETSPNGWFLSESGQFQRNGEVTPGRLLPLSIHGTLSHPESYESPMIESDEAVE